MRVSFSEQRHFAQRASKAAGAALLATALAATLSACGGGGGGDDDPLIAQGRYTTATGVSPAYTVLVVPASAGAHQAWAVSSTGDRLAKLSLSAANAVTGKRYNLSADPITPEAVTGTATLAGPASSASLSLPGLSTLPATATVVSRTDRLTEAATLATVAGSWSGSFDAGARTATWTISGAGVLSGFSTTGCTYTGNLVARNDAPVFDVSFTQTCPGVPSTTVTSFSGLARVSGSAGSTGLTVVAVSTNEETPWVSLFTPSAI